MCHNGTMNLTNYVERLQGQLASAAAAGGEEARELATRLTAPLDSAARLVLLEALAAAADEITGDIAPGRVELRLRGGEPEFVVIGAATDDDFESPTPPVGIPDPEDSGTARLNLRLPENLKERIEQAASAEGLSLNAWLTRAAHAALASPTPTQRHLTRGSDQFTGWVR